MLLVRLHVDYIDLLKLKAYKLFEISDADLSWFLVYRSQLVSSLSGFTDTPLQLERNDSVNPFPNDKFYTIPN